VERKGRRYLLIDTAGVRRKSRISQNLERYSVMRSISSIERCDVCVLLLDSVEGLVEQDVRLAGLVEDRGKGLVIGLNKWDLMEKDHRTFDRMCRDIREDLFFIPHAPIISLSGLTGLRLDRIFEVRFYYATQTGTHPPTFLVFTNRPREIRDNYLKYLERRLREELGFQGTPIRLKFRRGREDGRRDKR
jgi:GTP-binding protein